MHRIQPLPGPSARLVLTLSCVVLAFAAACDDALEIAPEEQRIALGATPRSVCPSPESPGSTELSGDSTIVATVFAPDGAVQEGLPVEFVATRGILSETTVETNEAGQAQTTLTAQRLDNVPVTVTARNEDGTAAEVEVFFPGPPAVGLTPSSATPVLGTATLSVFFQVAAPCNVAELRFRITYDPDVLHVSERPSSGGEPWVAETGAFNGTSSGGGTIPTILDMSASNDEGWLSVAYRRDDVPRSGVSSSLTVNFLTIAFDVLAAEETEIGLDDLLIVPSYGQPYDVPSDRILLPTVTGTDPDSDGTSDEES